MTTALEEAAVPQSPANTRVTKTSPMTTMTRIIMTSTRNMRSRTVTLTSIPTKKRRDQRVELRQRNLKMKET